MFDLFSSELPLAVRFAIAFIVVLLLFVAAAWVVKRLGGAKLAGGSAAGGGRGRQPRLGVLDVLSIDSRRRLVIVRRDNVEHLLMIGGPNDVVVESSIVRVPFAGREAPAVELGRPAEAPRAPMPLPVAVASQGGARQRPPAPPVQVPDPAEISAMMRGQAPTIRPAPEPAPPPVRPASRPPVVEAPPPLPEPVDEPPPRSAARPVQPAMPRATARPLSSPVAREQAPPPPRPAAPRAEPAPQPSNPRPRPARSEPAPPPPPAAPAPAADPLFTDIAQRLEQALRRPAPAPGQGRQAGGRAAAPQPGNSGGEGGGESRQPAERAPRDQGRLSQQSAPSRDSLEEEMASLLGRETGRDGGRQR